MDTKVVTVHVPEDVDPNNPQDTHLFQVDWGKDVPLEIYQMAVKEGGWSIQTAVIQETDPTEVKQEAKPDKIDVWTMWDDMETDPFKADQF